MSDEVSSSPASSPAPVLDAPAALADTPEGDVLQDDATLLAEAIAMANGPRKDAPKAEAPKVEVVEEKKAEAPAKEEPAKAAPTADEWEKYYSKQKELEGVEAKMKEREDRVSAFEKAKDSGDVEQMLKLLGYDDGVKFLREIAEHGSKPSKERSEFKQLQKEIADLKAARDSEAKARAELEQRTARDNAIAEKKAEITGFIEKHEKLSKGLVTIPGAQEQVFGKIAQHYQRTLEETGKGVELTVEQAANMVEKDWEDSITAIAKNPRAQELFRQVMGGAKAPATPAKGKAPVVAVAPKTLQGDEDLQSIRRGDKEMKEALAWMASRQNARRSS